jgi:indole-3-glycerol phosphate synthase
MDFLTEIISLKREQLLRLKTEGAAAGLRERAFAVRERAQPHALSAAIRDRPGINIIAEIKRASPSKGSIRDDVSPAWMATQYEAGGARAISVLTEEDRFRGSLDDLREVRRAVSLPLLRKDFIFDEFQLYEAAEAGADALLLIVAALEAEELARLVHITEAVLRMDALVEVHTRDEMSKAQGSGATLVGVNNRNLRTFEVSLDTSVELARLAPPGLNLVSESGLRRPDDLRRLRALGYKGFLVGETLMRAPRPGLALRELIEEGEQQGGRMKDEG